MYVAFDPAVQQPQPSPAVNPFARTPQVDPAGDRARAGRDARQGDTNAKGKAQSFRSILNETDEESAVGKQAVAAGKTRSEQARATKLPTRESAELIHSDDIELYAATRARETRTSSRITSESQGDSLVEARSIDPREFLNAVSQYAARVFAASNAYAAKGDQLEISA